MTTGDRAVVAWLRSQDHEVLTSFEARNTRKPDADQLEFAAERGWVIYTANADYARLHAQWRARGGATWESSRAYQQLDVGEQIRRLGKMLNDYRDTDMTNVFIYL